MGTRILPPLRRHVAEDREGNVHCLLNGVTIQSKFDHCYVTDGSVELARTSPGGALPHNVRLDFDASDEFVQRLFAFLEGEGLRPRDFTEPPRMEQAEAIPLPPVPKKLLPR